MTAPVSASRSEFAVGWKVLGAGFVGVMCGASPIPFNIMGTLFEPLQAEFGWNRTQISAGITIFGVVAALLAPVYGSLADKHGVRKVALWSLVAFALSFALLAATPASIYGFWALWLVVGLVGIGSTPVTWSRAISMWFVKHRGLALGIMLLGTSAAALFVPRLAVWSIENFGWREMFLIVSLLPLLVALPIGLLFFREPRPEERPQALSTGTGELVGMTFAEARRTKQFWLLWFSIVLIAFAYGGAHIHIIPIVRDHGFDIGTAASIAGIVGVGILVGRLSVGFLLDRFWGPAVAFPALCVPAAACFMLMGTDTDLALISGAAFMLGFAAGAESDLIAFLAARYFGMAHFGRIYGMLYMPFGLFSAISPIVYGRVRDTTGSYDGMLLVAAGLFIVGATLLLGLGRYPDLKAAQPQPAE
jgi:MFS family permease